MSQEKILLSHGSGGKLTHNLIKDIFAKYFSNEYLDTLSDSALLNLSSNEIAFTTDSYVIKPLKFPGGDIGKLAICGTVNDLAVEGATPKYISCGFIIEEGLDLAFLEEIVSSMAKTAEKAGVKIVTGDTKVVENGSCDGLFINTAGIGIRNNKVKLGCDQIKPGDKIIVNGTIGDHGMAVMAAREGLDLSSELESDCAPLNHLINNIIQYAIRFMRDATRGGLATTLCEIAEETGLELEINETDLPIDERVMGIAEVLGIDPIYSANEGKFVLVVSPESADKVLEELKKDPLGENASIIGEIKETKNASVRLKTEIGTYRQVAMLTGAQLPRIC